MKKRGALFYIIDAFIAASIVAITTIIIVSSFISVPQPDNNQAVLNNAYRFFEQTELYLTPGDVGREFIQSGNISNGRLTLFEAMSELIATNHVNQARYLAKNMAQEAVQQQMGFSIVAWNSTHRYKLYSQQDKRYNTSAISLSRQIIVNTLMEPTTVKNAMGFPSTTGSYLTEKAENICQLLFNANNIDYQCRTALNPGGDMCCTKIIFPCDDGSQTHIFEGQYCSEALISSLNNLPNPIDCTSSGITTIYIECKRNLNAQILGPYTFEVSVWS